MRRLINVAIILCLFLITLVSTSRFSRAAFIMTPYLQAVTENSIYVLEESDSKDPVTVEYGETSDYGNQATTKKIETTTAIPKTYVHKIKLTGLQPNMRYHYRVSQGNTHSADFTFQTAVSPGTPFRFAWIADCRTGTKIHDQIAAQIKSAGPNFSIYGGDLCASSLYQSFKDEFFIPNELALIANVPFFNTPGNHEDWSQNTRAFTEAQAFTEGLWGLTFSSENTGYYSFDYGDLHALVLNNEARNKGNIKESAQYVFAKADLQNTTKPWKIVVSHSPAYCAGGHGEDKAMKIYTKDIFEPNGVDLVISGHSHFYQHNLVNGIHHLIIGSAGAPLYQPKKASYTVKSIKDYNYAIIDESSTTLDLTVYNNRGKILEQINLTKP
ncbi:MAG TPA: metallophosphoesterase family protein [Bacillota bacterium]|nr:metallophosphoesterase family protein [Bacillota bacterium]